MKTWYVIDNETGTKKRFPSELDCAFFITMAQDFFPDLANAQNLTYYWKEE
tara:strand:+ start:490 stop:642 length:153 start_codon:yes stop_codon:yes gene_type:complete